MPNDPSAALLSHPLFLENELVLLPCQSNHSGWASIRVFNPHSLVSSLSLCQKITAFSLNGVGTVSCPRSDYLNFCICGGGWRGLIHQLLCYMHIDKHKRHLLLYHVLWCTSRDVPDQIDIQIILLCFKTGRLSKQSFCIKEIPGVKLA